jgi:YbgC/YbaW family acyl-CoA thioester hydrolase
MSDTRPLVMQDRVRWGDVDLIGIMRFSAFTRLIENGEQELLRAAGLPYASIFEGATVWMPRRHLAIEYLAPARIDELLTVVTYVSRLGVTSLTLQVDVWNADQSVQLVGATMVVVCVTAETFAKRPLPRMVRDALSPFVCSAEAIRARFVPSPAEMPLDLPNG